jgi:hypothetical protein
LSGENFDGIPGSQKFLKDTPNMESFFLLLEAHLRLSRVLSSILKKNDTFAIV